MCLRLPRFPVLWRCVATAAMLLGGANAAWAYTDCTVSPSKIYSGDDGSVWFHYDNGGAASLPPSDPDLKNSLALATAALLAGKHIVVRYAADGVDCTSWGRSDLIGMYLVSY